MHRLPPTVVEACFSTRVVCDAVDDVLDLIEGHVREEGDGEGRLGDRLGDREVAGPEAVSVLVVGLKVDRDEVGSAGHAVGVEAGDELVAIDARIESDDVDEPAHAGGFGRDEWDGDGIDVAEALGVPGSDLGASGEDIVQPGDLAATEGGAHLVEAVVVPEADVIHPGSGVVASLIGEASKDLGVRVVVGDDDTALAGGHLLVGIEGEDGGFDVRIAADAVAVAFGSDGLAGVLYDREVVLAGDGSDRIDVARLAEDINGNDGASAIGHLRLDPGGVDVEGIGIDVGENGRRALIDRAVCGGDETER